MTAVQLSGDMEVNITWNHSSSETSRDIDTYVYAFEGLTQKAKVYHSSKTYSDDNTKITLDKDDTGSSDGENVTIKPVYDGYSYHLYLKDYNPSPSTQSTHFTDWTCTVRITYNNKVVKEILAPTTARGKYWDVMTVTNSEVNIINVFTSLNLVNVV